MQHPVKFLRFSRFLGIDRPRSLAASRRPTRLFRLPCLALAAVALGGFASPVWAGGLTPPPNPFEPRVEEVLDEDGSIWRVLIVPRPLLPIVPPHCRAVGQAPLGIGQDPSMKILPGPPAVDAPEPQSKDDKSPREIPAPTKPKAPAPEYDPASKSEPALPKLEKPADDQSIRQEPDPFHAKELISAEVESPAADNQKAGEAKDAKDAAPKPKPSKKSSATYDESSSAPADFGVTIVPRPLSVHSPSAACCLPAHHSSAGIDPRDYAVVYASIPFLRSEYVANPSYRHEATMEILFGKLRPTVIHKHPPEARPHETLYPFDYDYVRPYSYYALVPGRSLRGPGLFSYPGAYGRDYYNFHYPRPAAYWAY